LKNINQVCFYFLGWFVYLLPLQCLGGKPVSMPNTRFQPLYNVREYDTGVSTLYSVHLNCVVYMMISHPAFPLSEQYFIKMKEEIYNLISIGSMPCQFCMKDSAINLPSNTIPYPHTV
jgi:hypothetical protein